MQLVKTERDNLLRPLQTVSGIVERRHTLPILANLLITKNGADVSFLSTDLELQITTHADFGVGSDQVATTVAARKLLDILRAMPPGEVALDLSDKRLTVHSGKSRFALQTLAADEFPTVNQSTDFGASLSVPQKTFRQLLGMVHFAMAQQDIRYYLNGMLLVVDGEQLMAVATDGHRLAFSSMKIEGSFARQEVIIPRKTILELQRLLEDIDDNLKIDIAPTQVKFTFGQVELVSKLVEGKFPDFQRVIPEVAQEHVPDRPRRIAALAATRGDSHVRQVQGRALPRRAGPVEDHVDQRRPGRSAGRTGNRLSGRQRRYRVQRHVSARRAREPEDRQRCK